MNVHGAAAENESATRLALAEAQAEGVAAAAVLDDKRRIMGWSREAETLFGYAPGEVIGRPCEAILTDAVANTGPFDPPGAAGIHSVRHRDGHPVPVALSLNPVSSGAEETIWLVTAVSAERFGQWAMDRAMLTGFAHESPIELLIFDTSCRIQWVNTAFEEKFGLTLRESVGAYPRDIIPEGELLIEDGRIEQWHEQPIETVLRTGKPLIDVRFRTPTPLDPHHMHVWSLSYFRLHDAAGTPIGVCEAGLDITDRYVIRQRLSLLSRAGGSIGRTLDIRRTAGELVDLVVPEFADAAAVDLLEPVLEARDSSDWTGVRPAAMVRVSEHSPGGMDIRAADARRLRLTTATADPDPPSRTLAVPIMARGTSLGVATFLRIDPRDPFDREEIDLAEELVSRTAVCIDNARRYAREHAIALTLQHDLLPHALPGPSGVEVSHCYLPAAGPAGVGGDWYDVIPLSGARVGLVVGDVAGHGARAAATMGRLRTTVAALAALDLAPDELLARLDDLVARTGAPQPADAEVDEDHAMGVTCLYAIYDPVSRHCVMARAGHLPPILVTPEGHADIVDLPVGPPLGLGGLPFESAGFDVTEGSLLALFTDGLVESRDPERDIDTGIRDLCDALSGPRTGPLDDTCDAVMGTLLPQPPGDDAALLLTRVHALADHQVATWDVPADPGEVSRIRRFACERLGEWGVDETAAYVVELVVSELVTNAIRYGGRPIGLRLIRDRGLIVEVSDGGHTSPHLRRATNDDEGGRGLFLVAQMTQGWGTRYTASGKTIWTEMPLTPAGFSQGGY